MEQRKWKKGEGGSGFALHSEWVRYEPAVPFTQVAIISLGISVSVCQQFYLI